MILIGLPDLPNKLIVKKVKVLVSPSCLIFCDTTDYNPPGSFVHGVSRQEYCSGKPFFSRENLPDSGIKPRSPILWANSLPSEPPRKVKLTVHPVKQFQINNERVFSVCPKLYVISTSGKYWNSNLTGCLVFYLNLRDFFFFFAIRKCTKVKIWTRVFILSKYGFDYY